MADLGGPAVSCRRLGAARRCRGWRDDARTRDADCRRGSRRRSPRSPRCSRRSSGRRRADGPWWYTLFWVAAIAMLALSRRTRFVILSASRSRRSARRRSSGRGTARGRVDAADARHRGIEPDRFGRRHAAAPLRLRNCAPMSRRRRVRIFSSSSCASDIAAAGISDGALRVADRQRGRSRDFKTADIPIPIDAIATHRRRGTRDERDDSRSGSDRSRPSSW